MTYRFHKERTFGLVLAIIRFGLGCASTSQIDSHWTDQAISIDAKSSGLTGAQTSIDDKGTSVGVFNDKEYLYFGLTTTNTDLQNLIKRQGLTLWFDASGGQGRKFGIHYPVRMPRFERNIQEGEDGDEQAMAARMGGDGDNLEICGPGDGEHHQMTKAEATGIDVRYRASNDMLVYEIKVPLADNGHYPFAIGTKTGELIGIGVEAGGRQLQKREGVESSGWGGRRGSDPGDAGFGGRGEYGGHRGPRGGSEEGGENSGSRPDPFKSWLKVQLATQDTLKR